MKLSAWFWGSPCTWERICLQCRSFRFDPWVRKILWRRKWQITPGVLPGKSHGRGALEGYSPWGCKELGMTYWLNNDMRVSNTFATPGYIHCRKPQMMCVFYSLFWGSTLFWEGNDNPLQYSFLENPMNGGDLWATQSIESQNWPRLSTSLSFFFSYWYRLVLSLLQHFTVFSE